jgi:WD40 repeat protein
VQLWDITKGELLGGRMAKLASEITSVAFSMDGIRLAIGSSDGTVRIWDLSTNELIDPPFRRDAGEPDPIEVIAFTPDGRLASASRRGAKLLDFTNPPIDIPLPSGPLVTSVAISPDGGRFAAGLADGTLRLLDLATQTAIDPPSGRKTDWLGSLTLSSSGARAAAVGLEPWVWDVSMGKIIGIPLGGPETVSKVALSPDGARLAVAYQDGTLRLLDLATGAQIGRPFGGNRERGTQSMSFSPNGLRLATSTIDGTVEVWDLSAIPDGNLFAITCSWLPGPNGVPDTDIAGALASVGALIENVDPICGPGYDPPGAWWMTPGEADGTLPRRAVVPEPSGEP